MMKITFIGGGNMASALIGGLRRTSSTAEKIIVIEPVADNRERLTMQYGVHCAASINDDAMDSDVWVLAVKPQQMRSALQPLAARLSRPVVVSIAAGLRLADIARWLGGQPRLVRAMPNTPALVGAGITGLFAAAHVDAAGRAAAQHILEATGRCLWVNSEEQLDALTAISGSGPAYVFYFMEALQAAAINLGFTASDARLLTLETFRGACALTDSGDALATLRERVTSKGGTTAAALEVFNHHHLAQSIAQGVSAAHQRSISLGYELGQS